ncbi:MAG: helix-turn-helix domain-containing protein [Pirellulaceae bacterium]
MQDELSQAEKYGEQVLLTVRDVARVLKISIASVYAIVAEGKIACHRVGTGRGSIRFEESDLADYLSSCRMEKAEETKRTPRPRLKHLKL